ncbi:NmrA family NAD(P)-binding protein [Actinokineospora pegani]|uniref:NmrA family NAD(P)-binding protein n=1 Tax=Actinokineospora pegani TaxID=2654637 RepID=UPI0012E9DF55|nr:NmrA family NAD(P)-binding protein [Actinokineospora pegani]
MNPAIAVTTPTGRVGGRVVRLLAQAGVRPRVLVRDPARLDPGLPVDIRQGTLDDAAYLREATAGVRSLFVVDPTSHAHPDPVSESAAYGDRVARAVRENGIRRVVFLSSVGAELRHGAGHIDGLARIEESLDATGADVAHLRAGYFFTNLLMDPDSLAAGSLPTTFDPGAPMPWVDPRDIGDVAAARLLSPAWGGRVVQGVHGPEDLSFDRVAEILTDVLGHGVRAVAVADDDMRSALSGAGLSPAAVEGIVGMAAGTRGHPPDPTRGPLTTTPTTLASWAAEHVR